MFWLHDAGDRFEPIAETTAAAAAPREGPTELTVSHLISHASPLPGGQEDSGPGFWLGEMWTLLAFSLRVLRAGG